MRRRWAWGSGTFVVLLVAAACARPAPPPQATTAPGPTTPASPTTAAPRDPFAMNCEPVDYQGAPATLSFYWWVGGGDSPSDKWVRDAFDCFAKKYAGKITLDIEYVPGQHDYIAKLKADYAAGNLPVIVTLKRDPSVAQVLIENDELVDLMPYFKADPQWQAVSLPDSVELNTVNGKLVAAPDTFQTAIGYFYNKEQLQAAGVTTVPEDWDGFYAMLEQIKGAGIPPLCLHTQETGWSAMLLYEALIARTPEGRDFLNITFPDNFHFPFMVDATRDLVRLLQFTTPDAIGAVYAQAANNFLSEKCAIMPNGPWMIGDFRDPSKAAPGFGDKVGVALYPGNVAIDDTGRQLGDWAVAKRYPKEVIDAAVELIKWMNSPEVVRQRVLRLGSTAPNLPLPEEDLEVLDPLAAELIKLVQDHDAPILPNYQGQWNTVIQNETIVQVLVASTPPVPSAFWGELITTRAMVRGCVGAVVDGYTRDLAAIRAYNFPLWACGTHPADSAGRLEAVEVGGVVRCGGVEVHRGDVVLGDLDGVVVVPASVAEAVVEAAEAKATAEDAVRSALREGLSAKEAFARYRVM
jgi:raffinose/stachyose/melibiose transport system substrate-binding protein